MFGLILPCPQHFKVFPLSVRTFAFLCCQSKVFCMCSCLTNSLCEMSKGPHSNLPQSFIMPSQWLTSQSIHVASFKNESQMILAFCDFALHRKMLLLHVMYFEIRKLIFYFTLDIRYFDLFTPLRQFFTTIYH